MYKFLRNSHLILGAFSFLFVLMYGVSSVQMAHNTWFNNKPLVNESSEKIAPMMDARKAARVLMDKYSWRGELGQVTTRRDDLVFRVIRPGVVYEVTYAPVSGDTKIKTNVANWMGMLNRIHHIGGFWHEYSLINVWSVFVALISVSLILIALSGIYLWFKIHKERLIGGVLLAGGLIYGLGLMILLRIA
jgi:hypothetical protein